MLFVGGGFHVFRGTHASSPGR